MTTCHSVTSEQALLTGLCDQATASLISFLKQRQTGSQTAPWSQQLLRLVGTLETLAKTGQEQELADLEALLSQRRKACQDFKVGFAGSARRPLNTESVAGGGKVNDDDTDAFNRTVAAYETAMLFASWTINSLRFPDNSDELSRHHKMILEKTDDLAERLEAVNTTLKSLRVQTLAEADIRKQLEQERECIQRCLEVCRGAANQLEVLQNSRICEQADPNNSRQELGSSVGLEDTPSSASQKADHNGPNTLKHVMLAEDGFQVMASTSGRATHAEDVKTGARAVHISGDMSDTTIQHIISSRGPVSVRGKD